MSEGNNHSSPMPDSSDPRPPNMHKSSTVIHLFSVVLTNLSCAPKHTRHRIEQCIAPKAKQQQGPAVPPLLPLRPPVFTSVHPSIHQVSHACLMHLRVIHEERPFTPPPRFHTFASTNAAGRSRNTSAPSPQSAVASATTRHRPLAEPPQATAALPALHAATYSAAHALTARPRGGSDGGGSTGCCCSCGGCRCCCCCCCCCACSCCCCRNGGGCSVSGGGGAPAEPLALQVSDTAARDAHTDVSGPPVSSSPFDAAHAAAAAAAAAATAAPRDCDASAKRSASTRCSKRERGRRCERRVWKPGGRVKGWRGWNAGWTVRVGS
eukprot:274163-Chlamydomonas_euryale.AAC.2